MNLGEFLLLTYPLHCVHTRTPLLTDAHPGTDALQSAQKGEAPAKAFNAARASSDMADIRFESF